MLPDGESHLHHLLLPLLEPLEPLCLGAFRKLRRLLLFELLNFRASAGETICVFRDVIDTLGAVEGQFALAGLFADLGAL